MKDTVQHCYSTKKFSSMSKGHWGELFLLYSDGTWEEIFDYHWSDPLNVKIIPSRKLIGKTREEVIAFLKSLRYDGKLEGAFIEEGD